MREHETDPRVPIPASDWDLARAETKDDRVVLTPSNVQPPYTLNRALSSDTRSCAA